MRKKNQTGKNKTCPPTILLFTNRNHEGLYRGSEAGSGAVTVIPGSNKGKRRTRGCNGQIKGCNGQIKQNFTRPDTS